jgi:serine/threonine protein kinase
VFALCQVFPLDKYRESLSPYWQVDDHPCVARSREIILGQSKAYILFPKGHGDLHSYVREKKRLREGEARELFSQIVAAVLHCHDNGVILRDLKLRKFVFADAERSGLFYFVFYFVFFFVLFCFVLI